MITVDDHRPGADFPVLTSNLSGLASRIVEVLLRGGTVTEDPTAAEADQTTDADVAVAVARGIIEEQSPGPDGAPR